MDDPKNTILNEYFGLYVSSVSNNAYLSLNTHFKWHCSTVFKSIRTHFKKVSFQELLAVMVDYFM